MVDDRRTDNGRTPNHGHPISSPCEPNGSGELKMCYIVQQFTRPISTMLLYAISVSFVMSVIPSCSVFFDIRWCNILLAHDKRNKCVNIGLSALQSNLWHSFYIAMAES